MDWRQSRPLTGVLYLLETAQAEGVDAATCLIGSAITRDAMHQPNAQIEAWQELAVIRNLIEHAGRQGLGFTVGQRYHLTSLGLLGFTMLASRTLGEAFATFGRFHLLGLTLCPRHIEADRRGLWLLFDASVLPQDARAFVIERGLSACLGVAAELLQRPVAPLVVEMTCDAPTDVTLLQRDFPYPVQFNAARNGILFSHADLQSSLPQAHIGAHSEGEQLCERLCVEISHSLVKPPTARLVQQVLIRDSVNLLSGRTVAERLGLSERTLYRRLATEGHAFQQLNEQIKQRLAERLLSKSRLDLNDIAQRLGYAEAASFSRAFSRWTGCSPRHWQRRNSL
ncbi:MULTISPECIES: AraC family transcriptional regulator [Pseudomonadaceae]|uniref:AraC family transcriptional regulator n=1 Tax=Pseudomonadaceae TaxID=135621 RepID=UPI00103EC99E|nr:MULTISPECIES: AraC family transcriptional regulator [Pseudomonadaceae]MBA1276285.1 AraC family transcriptional regulator [Stutzerimonas stutzeri]MBC8648793.1 AraC family transcriptional regulator [Pseudomonas sp. MT4]QXY92766.1 AraC family transcriptional regulator [Pseudomonas sp. MTM4]TCD22420.1 AraC family transcriptional regulator [Pseudomonas sp. IC_126]